ncbi:MAG: 30S ribosomal protein S1 [Clostridia bacterium]|nr:30S ribosomal protein S1 [Clostridia bacterium]
MKEYYPEGRLISSLENRKIISSPVTLAQAQASETILEGNVIMCDNLRNMTVDLGCMRGIIPRGEGAIGIAEGVTRDIALISRVGRPVSFIVTAIKTDDKGRLYAILSRKAAQIKCRDYILNEKRVGDIIEARVTHLESFGAFCDIGCGNVALLPIDSISVSRIAHPMDRLKVGQSIKAIIKNIDEEGRITLTRKELLGTWEENVKMFSPGQTVSGIVRSIENYGIFVELTANLAGLAEPKDNVYIGQQASVYIKSIIPEKMKIKLIIIDSFDGGKASPEIYFYEGEHMERFEYSPPDSYKKIVTEFSSGY